MAMGGPLGDRLKQSLQRSETLARLAAGERLRHGAAPSLPAADNEAIDGIVIGQGVGSCGASAYLGHPLYVTDIASDPLWKDFEDLALG